jgi:hypothetical protein
MATQAKKPPPPPVEDAADSTPVPYAVPVAPEPEPAPELVEPYRVLNDDQVRRVNAIKTHFGDSVVYLQTLRNAYHASETLQAIDVAIVHAETASMWAVRAVTKAI